MHVKPHNSLGRVEAIDPIERPLCPHALCQFSRLTCLAQTVYVHVRRTVQAVPVRPVVFNCTMSSLNLTEAHAVSMTFITRDGYWLIFKFPKRHTHTYSLHNIYTVSQ